jgi:hypothetical protein
VDHRTSQILIRLGIPPETVPPGSVKFFGYEELRKLAEKSRDCRNWLYNPDNHEAIVYAVDHEHKRAAGIALRNLHSGPKKSHKIIAPDIKPLWHNLWNALPRVYQTSVATLVEGPKDALVLNSFGVPAIACLTAIPYQDHLRVLRRYAQIVLWIGDRDPPDEKAELRKAKARRQSRELGLKFIEFPIMAKDPGELAGNVEWLTKIRDRVEELSYLTR